MKQELEQDKYKGLGNGTWNEGYFPTAIEKPTKLEQAATKWSMDNQEGFCTHSMKIAAFKAGAKWQKKQDELTWEDISKIIQIADMLFITNEDSVFPTRQSFCEEVLKKFNEQKNKEI